MDQSQFTTATQPQPDQPKLKAKAPIFVIILAGLIFLSGIYFLRRASGYLLASLRSDVIFGEGGIILIQGIGLVVVSLGLIDMRRWALYTYSALFVVAVWSFLSFLETKTGCEFFGVLVDFAVLGIQVPMLIYLWSIFKRFT